MRSGTRGPCRTSRVRRLASKALSGQRAKASIAVSPNADRCPVSQSLSQAIPCANTLVVDRFSMGRGSRRGGKFSAHVSLLPGAVEQVLD
jgi:hypothetical protein